jgi:hypothetical protein
MSPPLSPGNCDEILELFVALTCLEFEGLWLSLGVDSPRLGLAFAFESFERIVPD